MTFATPNGIFHLPIECRPPQVEPEISTLSLDFGSETIGEIREKCFTLKNGGMLPGKVKIDFDESDDEILVSIDGRHITPRDWLKFPPKTSLDICVEFSPKIVGSIEKFVQIDIFDENDNPI